MIYDEFTYLYPPRPEKAIASTSLHWYESQRYWAQVKRNGDCTLIFCKGDDVRFMNRHGVVPTRWTPTADHYSFFRGSPKWEVFVAERIDNDLYIFDQIVRDGFQLVDTSFRDRQIALYHRWKIEKELDDEFLIGKFVTVAKSHLTGFDQIFNRLTDKDEGLVLKNPYAKMNLCFRDKQNGSWQVKSRRTTKNYSF